MEMVPLKRKRFTLMPAVALAALGALTAIPTLSSSGLYAATPSHYMSISVRPGDSLWKLAAAHTSDRQNVEDTIDAILAVNHLSSATIVPGQHLKIPL
jgi:predicted Zn-dependent protease